MREYLEKFKEELENFKKTKVKCRIIGRSGTGKSSLINAIVGEKIADVGVTETTMEVGQPYENRGLLFYDLPGCSTEKFPRETYIEKMGIKDSDCVIIVTSDRFYEDDLFLITEIAKIQPSIAIYAVRTKIDYSVQRNRKDKGEDEETTLRKIYEQLRDNIQDAPVKGIYLTSADYPTAYDLDKLLNDISSNLSEIKKERFIADVTITSEKVIKEKRKIAEKLVSRYAALAAANGLNPIPGLDVSVDIGLILKMSNDITAIYGLNKEDQDYYKGLVDLPNQVQLKAALSKAAQYLAKYGAKEAIMILLKRFAASVATKSLSKWVPLVGQAIAAGIGFKMTSSLGEDMIEEGEKTAIEIFESFKQ